MKTQLVVARHTAVLEATKHQISNAALSGLPVSPAIINLRDQIQAMDPRAVAVE